MTWLSRFGAVTGVAQGPYEGHSLSQDVLCFLARCAVHENLIMPARSGTLVQAKCWHAAGGEPLMSEREARITLIGPNKRADVLCIKTFLCLQVAVSRYKQNVGMLPGMIP